jgi:carbamoyl-phosphate synthase large subunit
VFVPAIMQHVELAGIHSGDSACSIPPYDLPETLVQGVLKATKELASRLEIKGLLNVQYAIQNGEIYCLEANPRASRTVPFVSKASGVPLAKLATRVIMGQKLDAPQDLIAHKKGLYFVKEAVFPFLKFQEVDAVLGPEMKSTGEVMGVGRSFSEAYLKAQWAAGSILPKSGKVFLSVRDADKSRIVPVAKGLLALGFELIATRGTKAVLQDHGIEATQVNKVHEGRPHIVDLLKDGQIGVVINTPEGSGPVLDSFDIRRACLVYNVPYMTTIAGARAALVALEGMHDKIKVLALQDFHNA